MKRFRMLACLAVLAFVAIAPALDEQSLKKLKSGDARKAIADYDKAVKQFQDVYAKDEAAARKKLLADLDAAQDKATKANDLDDAVRIRDLRKEYEGVAPAPVKDAKIQIVSAFYGGNVNWADVTDKVRAAVKDKGKWAVTVSTNDWGDPAPGWDGKRTLIIRYTVGNKVQFKVQYEGKEISLP